MGVDGLGAGVIEIVEENYSPNAVRERIKKIYSSLDFSKFLNSLSDDEVIEVAKRIRNGVFVATPVFDGATADDG